MRALLFDIDGTLTIGGGAGSRASERGLKAVAHRGVRCHFIPS